MSTQVESAGRIIDGTTLAKSVRDAVAARIKAMQTTYPRFQPQLVIVQAGQRPDSTVYVKMKAKAAEEVGIKFRHIALPAEIDVQSIVDTVKKLNDDEQVSGIWCSCRSATMSLQKESAS